MAVDLDTGRTLDELGEWLRALLKRSAKDIIAIGATLIDVKGRLPHGEFEAWVKRETNLSKSSAERFMRVARWATTKSVTVTDLDPTALYALAAAPPAVQDEIVTRLEQGQKVTLPEVRKKAAEARDTARKVRREARLSPATRKKHTAQRLKDKAEWEQHKLECEQRARRAEAAVDELATLIRAKFGDDVSHVLSLLRTIEADSYSGDARRSLIARLEAGCIQAERPAAE